MAGAFWKLGTHDYVGAVLAAGAAMLGLKGKDGNRSMFLCFPSE
jgi:hypothetical protein